jgi:hypothetical protein
MQAPPMAHFLSRRIRLWTRLAVILGNVSKMSDVEAV